MPFSPLFALRLRRPFSYSRHASIAPVPV